MKAPQLTLGDRLMLAREHAGITSQEMATHMQVSRHTITGWEKGRHAPTWSTIVRWAELTGYDAEWIRNGESEVDSETQRIVGMIRRARGLAPGERLELSTNGITFTGERRAA